MHLTSPKVPKSHYTSKSVDTIRGYSTGTCTQDVLEAAQRRVPGATWRDIVLISVPKSLHVVYTA